SVWPSSCRRTPATVHGEMLPNVAAATRSSRPLRDVLGKNERARYWLVLTWRTSNTTFAWLLQLPSGLATCTYGTLLRVALSQAPAAGLLADRTVLYWLPKLPGSTQ